MGNRGRGRSATGSFPAGMLLAFLAFAAAAGEPSPENGDLTVVVTGAGIRVGEATVCSLAALEKVLAEEPRDATVGVEAAADAPSGMMLGVAGFLREIGFERLAVKSPVDGWTLYPPSPAKQFTGCEPATGQEAGEGGEPAEGP